MNAKLLFAATVAVSLVSTLAMAEPAAQPLTREQVQAELQQSAAKGTLRKTDYQEDQLTNAAVSTRSRGQVDAELSAARAAPKLPGSLASGSYNPHGRAWVRPSVTPRAQVTAELQQSIDNGTLARTDYQQDQTFAARAKTAGGSFLARLKKPATGQVGSDS